MKCHSFPPPLLPDPRGTPHRGGKAQTKRHFALWQVRGRDKVRPVPRSVRVAVRVVSGAMEQSVPAQCPQGGVWGWGGGCSHGGWDRRGCATWAPSSATRQGEEQHRHTKRGSHTKGDKGGHTRRGGGAQQGRRGYQNGGNREPEWSKWWSVRMGGSDNKGDGLASHPRRYRVPGQPLLNRHQVGGVSRSPDGLFAQQEREPIRGRPTVRGERTYGGRPGQRVEEQGTWAAQKDSEAGYGRPVDRGVWTAKTVKRPRQQPTHPQYANYWAPLTRKRHTMPHSAQSQHTNYWAPRTRKRHQQEHRPQRPTESSDPTQHAKGRPGDRPGPRKGATTRRNVAQGVLTWKAVQSHVGGRSDRVLLPFRRVGVLMVRFETFYGLLQRQAPQIL